MENARELAEGYYAENQLNGADETIAMACDSRFYLERGALTDEGFAEFYAYQAQARDLTESAIFQQLSDGSLRTAAIYDLMAENQPLEFGAMALPKLSSGDPVVGRAHV